MVKTRLVILSSLMLLAAANSLAMSLGRHRGAALIGKPLDVSVQAVLEAQDDVASLCLEADVFYADNKQDKSRVRVTAEKSANASQDAVIRIRSSSLVDEPVVTIYLRVGCQQKTERRYVTLSDVASDVLPEKSGPTQMAQAAPTTPPLAAPPTKASADSATAQNQTGSKKSKKASGAPGRVFNADAAVSPLVSRPDRAATKKQAATSRARLKLEPLDLSIERDPQLKSSTELLSAPSVNPQERLSAAALWQALNAQPQDILRDSQKLQMLEKSVQSLQAQSQKTQLSIDELGVRLREAQSERYANPLVYTLAALLLLALAGAAYLLRKRFLRMRLPGGDAPWWRKNDRSENLRQAWTESGSNREALGSSLPASAFNKNNPAHLKPHPPDIDLTMSQPGSGNQRGGQSGFADSNQRSDFDSDAMPPLAQKYRPDFSLSMTHATRAVKAEELFDVQQQADFFVSIGQHDQAIEVLRSHIGEGVETSALVYLDLFNLYHQLKREKDYSDLRAEFNRQFNTEIPAFDMYTDVAPGLEAYQLAMSRIEVLWPSPKVLEIIEESLFRKPNNRSEAFNLVAYRELLLLYSVAKEIITPEPPAPGSLKKFDKPGAPARSADSRPMTFAATSIQPLSASINPNVDVHADAVMTPVLMSTIPPASLNLGLDLDLSEPVDSKEKKRSADDIEADFLTQMTQQAPHGASAYRSNQVPTSKISAPSEPDNLIDFDAFDASVEAAMKRKTPKA